jgi:nucleoside-diphosphate-sugar epimerase
VEQFRGTRISEKGVTAVSEGIREMEFIETVKQLEERLARPTEADLECVRRLKGDIIILGAGGKMGPSLARRIKRATDQAAVSRRVMAVSRFSSQSLIQELRRDGIETFVCDLMNQSEVDKLPACENALYLSGRKFGSSERPDLTWITNTVAPSFVASRYRSSRLVAFSTGNVYPLVGVKCSGSVETDSAGPIGEYAQSCLGRERVFEFYSHERRTPVLLFRLNYAVDLRYGVLVDIARKVFTGQPIDLTIPAFNAIWQGDANSYALRCLELCSSPARVLNVTGPEIIFVRRVAEYFANLWRRDVAFRGEEGSKALLSDSSLCRSLLGGPEIAVETLMRWVARWVECGGVSLDKPTKFEVADGRF